ncbi:MAG: hypothetical protein ACK5O3_16665 [Burkholderiales bacterium]
MIPKRIQAKPSRWLFSLLLCSGLAVAQPTPWATPSAAAVDVMLNKANEAIVKGDWASAAGFHRWYHEHGTTFAPSHGGVRLSFALVAWRALAEKYPPALADLRDARDRAASKVRAGGHGLHRPMSDLTAIDEVLGDPRVTVDTFTWLRDRRPADAREFASLALPALLAADQAAMALPYIDPDEVLRSAQSTMNTFTQARFAPPNQSAEDRLRTAHGIVDGNAAPSVAALANGGERERAEALVAGLRAMLGPDAALPATVEALGGKAPRFGRFGAAPPLATPPVWTPPEQPDLDALRDQARADKAAGRFAQAAAYHRWYHANALNIRPSHRGVRLSFALSDWRALAEVYPPALQDLREARDHAAAQVRAGGPATRQATRDLVALEYTLADPSASAAIALWLQAHRPADLPAFVSEALPALVAAGNAALAIQHFDAKQMLAAIDETFKRLSVPSSSDRTPAEALRSAQSFADREAASAVAAMVQTGQAERARAFLAQLKALIGADAKLHACNDALRGFAPPFRR